MKLSEFENLVSVTKVDHDTVCIGKRFALISGDIHDQQIGAVRAGELNKVFFIEVVGIDWSPPVNFEFRMVAEDIEKD